MTTSTMTHLDVVYYFVFFHASDKKEEGISSENAKRVRCLERTMPFFQAVERI